MDQIRFTAIKICHHFGLVSGHNKRAAGRSGNSRIRSKQSPLGQIGENLRLVPQRLRAVRLIWINLRQR
jgi:hypothetical protein